jgi:hypothetical protein
MRAKKLFVASVITAAFLGTAIPAQASLSQCRATKMCAWGNNDFNWLIAAQVQGRDSWSDTFNNSNGEDDQTDSWANTSTSWTGCLADHTDGSGNEITMRRNSNDNNVSVLDSDMASSMKTANGC